MPMGFRQIADDIRNAIEDGTYPPGFVLPTEHRLAERYGVSRETVSRALRVLKAEGLLHTQTSLGTYVPPAPIPLTVTRYTANIGPAGPVHTGGPWETACADAGVDGVTHMLGVTREPATAALADRLQVPAGEILVRRSRLMTADGKPAQLQDAWMPLALIDGTPLAEDGKIAVGVYAAMVAAGLTIDRAVEKVSARSATTAERKALNLKNGGAVQETWRVTYDVDNRPVEALRVVGVGGMVTSQYELSLRTREAR